MTRKIRTTLDSEDIQTNRKSKSHKKTMSSIFLLVLLIVSGMIIGKLFSSGKFIIALVAMMIALIIMFLSIVFTIDIYDEDEYDDDEEYESESEKPVVNAIPVYIIQDEIAKKKYRITQLDKRDKQQNKERLELLKEVKYWNTLLDFWNNQGRE